MRAKASGVIVLCVAWAGAGVVGGAEAAGSTGSTGAADPVVSFARSRAFSQAAFRAGQSQPDPQAAAFWLNRGVALYHLHRYRLAERALRRALRARIDSAMAWNNLGAVYEQMGQDGYAAVAYQVALTFDATCAVARWNLHRITRRVAPIPGLKP